MHVSWLETTRYYPSADAKEPLSRTDKYEGELVTTIQKGLMFKKAHAVVACTDGRIREVPMTSVAWSK